jgi:hypothetical protein
MIPEVALAAACLDSDDVTDVSCALRSMAEVGPSARTRTLAGSVPYDEIHQPRDG